MGEENSVFEPQIWLEDDPWDCVMLVSLNETGRVFRPVASRNSCIFIYGCRH